MSPSASARTSGKLWICFVATLLVMLGASSAHAARPPHNGAPAPSFSLPLAANGTGQISLSQLHGRAVYLNFFASWCQPCKAEAASIAKLSREFSKHNVVVVGIDELEASRKAAEFASQYKLPYKIAIDDSGDVGGSYGLIGLPLHVFISADGKVAMHREGEMSESQIRAELLRLSRH